MSDLGNSLDSYIKAHAAVIALGRDPKRALRRRLNSLERIALFWLITSQVLEHVPISPALLPAITLLSIAINLTGIVAMLWLRALDRN